MLHISCLRARCKYKVLKVKHANKPQKTSKHPEEKKQRCLEKKNAQQNQWKRNEQKQEAMFVTKVKKSDEWNAIYVEKSQVKTVLTPKRKRISLQ